MLFSECLASMQPQDGGWSAVIGEDWTQGRATFGGLVGALGNEAMRRLVPRDRQLRELETVFVGPALAGPVHIEAQILRVGKAVTIASARLLSDGKIAATLTGIYGAARTAALTLAPIPATNVRPVEDLPEPDVLSHLGARSFLQHFAFRWAEGSRPFSGSSSRQAKIYIRHLDNAALTESHVVALVDCIPSVVLQMMPTAAPSSSLTWSLQILRHDYSFAPAAWWRIDAEVDSAANGYACESSLILDPNGMPAAISRQLVAVFG
jgi:acyl-CoA thioesterase